MSREELLLENILGASHAVIPQSRVEILLQQIAEQGRGGGADTFSVAFTQSGSATVCNHTHSEIRAAIAAGKIIMPTMLGYSYGLMVISDQIQTEFLFFDDTSGGNFIIVTMASDNSIAATTPGFALEPTKTTVSGATPTIAAEDNTIYSCGELTSLTITDSGQNISFVVDFASGSTPTAIFVPAGYKAPGGDLTPEASKTYELNVRNGKAVLTAFEAVSSGA